MTPNTDLPPSPPVEAEQGPSAGCAPTAGSPSSDTPETDAETITHEPDGAIITRDWVDAELCRKIERERNTLAAGLRETLALLNHSDTSYPQHEGWWSYERQRELERLLPENVTTHTPGADEKPLK